MVKFNRSMKEVSEHSIVEMPGGVGRSFQPPCDCVPGDPHHPCNRRLVDSFHAERRHAVECRTRMLKSNVRCARIGAESLAATRTAEATAPPPLGAIEGVTNDVALAQLAVVLAFGIRAGSVFDWVSHVMTIQCEEMLLKVGTPDTMSNCVLPSSLCGA